MLLSQKQKTFPQFFTAVLKSRLKFEHFRKKITLIAHVFPKLRTCEDAVDRYLKSAVSQYPWTSNMANALEHYSNHHGGTFTIFIDHCEGYWVSKSHS